MGTSVAHDKSEAVFQIDVSYTPKAPEKPLYVFLPRLVGQTPDINAVHTRHTAKSWLTPVNI